MNYNDLSIKAQRIMDEMEYNFEDNSKIIVIKKDNTIFDVFIDECIFGEILNYSLDNENLIKIHYKTDDVLIICYEDNCNNSNKKLKYKNYISDSLPVFSGNVELLNKLINTYDNMSGSMNEETQITVNFTQLGSIIRSLVIDSVNTNLTWAEIEYGIDKRRNIRKT